MGSPDRVLKTGENPPGKWLEENELFSHAERLMGEFILTITRNPSFQEQTAERFFQEREDFEDFEDENSSPIGFTQKGISYALIRNILPDKRSIRIQRNPDQLPDIGKKEEVYIDYSVPQSWIFIEWSGVNEQGEWEEHRNTKVAVDKIMDFLRELQGVLE